MDLHQNLKKINNTNFRRNFFIFEKMTQVQLIPCPSNFDPPFSGYILFVPNIRKYHNFYLYSSIKEHYLAFLVFVAKELLHPIREYPICHWRTEDCRNDYCWSCEEKMKTRECLIAKITWRILQVCAKILNEKQKLYCQKCGEFKTRFHTCYLRGLEESVSKAQMLLPICEKTFSRK
jgi:hypothetical protein